MTEVWSCGGGTQSGAIAALIRTGFLPRPDYAFMIDTGREKSSTWPFVDEFIRPQLAAVGLDLTIVQASQFADLKISRTNEDGEVSILLPGFSTLGNGEGKLSPFCSGYWKRDVGERWMRSVGIQTARNWIGISRDEARRIRAQHRGWLSLWYPLIFEVPITRTRCVDIIRTEGWRGEIPHSACWMCPNQSDAEWLHMKLNSPQDFESACALDDEARIKDPHFFLHESRIPLREVDFTQQRSMFADRGCTTGCFT